MSQLTHIVQLLQNGQAGVLSNLVKSILITIEPIIIEAIDAELKKLIEHKAD